MILGGLTLRSFGAALLFSAVLALGSNGAAHAAYDPVGSGQAQIRFDPSFVTFLRGNGIKPTAGAPGRFSRRVLSLPVVGGVIDPTIGKLSISAEGALVLQNNRRRVPFRSIMLKTKHSPLIAKVGGSQLKVASSHQLAVRRLGFGASFEARELRLSPKVAVRLNKKLRPPHPFYSGQVIGSLSTRANPLTATVLGANKVGIQFSSGFLSKLESLFVSVNPIFPAEHSGPSFTLSIIPGGAVAPDLSTGILKTSGDVEFLQLASNHQIFWHETWLDFGAHQSLAEVDLEPSPPLAGKQGQAPVLALEGGSSSANARSRGISFSGGSLKLNSVTAAAFNDAFAEGRTVFETGEEVGSLSFVAQAQ